MMIPQEKRDAVARALREAFGVTTFEDIAMLTKGHSSALVYRVVVNGTAFLLRIIMRTSDSTTADHFTCLRAAGEAGLAPRVWYASVADRISITDFVESVPFAVAEARVRMPGLLRELHGLSPFPGRVHHLNTSCLFLMNEGPARDGFMERFRGANILPEGETEQLTAWHSRLAAAFPGEGSDMVSSHNDSLKPDNILFDGSRAWLVDWEAAFLNDRYADLAVRADFLVTDEAEERVYLQHYFGRPADEYELARFVIMRSEVHLFYTMGFLFQSAAGERQSVSEDGPDFDEFHRRIWEGELNIGKPEIKWLYGTVHWNRMRRDRKDPRVHEALKMAASRRVFT